MKLSMWYVCATLMCALGTPLANADEIRIKDLGKFAGWRENSLVGYGLVTGLAGTGDSARNKATRQSLVNMLARFDLSVPVEDMQSRNVAAVMVTASLSPSARQGEAIDVAVTSIGDARSLVGGALILAPLKGADGRIYALAQGAVAVGGYQHDLNGNLVQKNHPTMGSIPSGAVVEVGVSADVLSERNSVTFLLAEPDFTTATRVSAAINSALGGNVAQARDAAGIEIEVPLARRSRLTDFLTQVENAMVEPDRRARVVINERTGTVVAGADVRIDKVAISHGELKVSIATDNSVSQPMLVTRTGPEVRTEVVANSRMTVEERAGPGFVGPYHVTVADLVQALSRLKTPTRDIISILRAVKAQGALHAELFVQ